MKAVYRKLTGMFFALMFASASVVCVGCSDGGSDGGSPAATPATPGSKGGDEKGDGGQGGDGKNPSAKKINLSDAPVGYASVNAAYTVSGTKTIVKNRDELNSALKNGGIIVIDGMIDMSDGMLPAAGSTSLTSTSKLDEFVHSTKSNYTNYADWVDKYTKACSKTTEDGKLNATYNSTLYSELWLLNREYGNKISLKIKEGTTLVGKSAGCGIRGGSIQINGDNIQIRNLTIQDACDPFPHHEQKNSTTSDGYNAQWDGVNIDNHKNIWIDHCTFEDTLTLGEVKTGTTDTLEEKWQIYDGLCDIKGGSTNITVSNCIFKNHDKTMLIGSDDSDGDNTKRFVTLYGNYFLNCVQRLPMVRNTTIHIFNNYYDVSNSAYENDYAIGRRKNCIVYAENNYFGSGIKYSIKETNGELHSSGNEDKSSKKSTVATDSALFSSLNKYTYTSVSASDAKTSVLAKAGAGCTLE